MRLSARGWTVDVFEKLPNAGGKANTESRGGYRFDTGPSLVTMPDVFEDLFAAAGETMRDDLEFVRLSPICRYFYPDGVVLDSDSDPEKFGAELARVTGDPGYRGRLRRYLRHARTIHDLTRGIFLENPLDAKSILRLKNLPALLQLPRIDAFRSLDRANASFFPHPKIRQLFDRYATYNGSSPYRAPATLTIIPHVEYAGGGYAVKNGITGIPSALERLARKKGARFFFGAPVEKIVCEQGRVTGVRVNGEFRPYPVVVSDVDVRVLYRDLLDDPGAPAARRYRKLEPSSSGLVFTWGIRREFPSLLVNNIFFSGDYPSEFADIFDRARIPADPTVYVNITSKVTPSDAPAGGENWFVLVNAPCDSGQDWAAETRRARRAVLDRLSRALGTDVEKLIETEGVLAPPDIESRTGSAGGALYGISSNTPGAAFLRHPNRSARHRGLYLCGGSGHPGGGMPLALLSGKIATDLIRQDTGS